MSETLITYESIDEMPDKGACMFGTHNLILPYSIVKEIYKLGRGIIEFPITVGHIPPISESELELIPKTQPWKHPFEKYKGVE